VPKDNTYTIPDPIGDSIMTLADIVGPSAAQQIESTGKLLFHATGDTGRGPDSPQQSVAEAMAAEVDPHHHETSPAFLLNLGDVIYGDGKDDLYDDEFYRPYADYPNKIIAIPGNHDGEEGLTVDRTSLAAFKANFCAPPGTQPLMATRFGHEMVNQPGVFWMLQTRLLDLIGLYSNAAEDFGVLADDPKLHVTNLGNKQTIWLGKRLQEIKQGRAQGQRKALVFAMHHPPYAQGLKSSGSGHPGNPDMLAQMDAVCDQAGIMPDAVLSGHTHTYARYMRHFTSAKHNLDMVIPYIVAGAGGHAAQPAPTDIGFSAGGVTYANGAPSKTLIHSHGSEVGYGYLTITVEPRKLTLAYRLVENSRGNAFESTAVSF
jgi:predicted phosphodiesterase